MQELGSSSWYQLIYGKPITKPNGSIKKGSEHQVTGKSPAITPDWVAVMTPSVTGIGSTDRSNWREFTWNEQGGGLVITRTNINGSERLIAGRIRGRSEMGEGKLGRMYTQTHYACIPVSDYAFAPTLGLFQALQPTPQLTNESKDLPELIVQNPTTTLPANWLELVTPLIRILLSGLPLTIKTTRRTMEEMTLIVHIVQSALPHSLAWRLSVKIGAFSCSAEEATLSIVEKLDFKMPRIVGFSMKDPEKNESKIQDVIGGEPHPILENTLLGERYIEYLRQHCADCTTSHELQSHIQQDFSRFQQWDYFDSEWSFSKTGVEFIQVLFEDDGLHQLEQALLQEAEFPSLKVFFHRKKEALELLLGQVWGYPQFILQTLNEWSDVWMEIYQHCSLELRHTIELLLSALPVSKAALCLMKETQIPSPYHSIVLRKLSAWLTEFTLHPTPTDTHLKILSELLEEYSQYPSWVQDWIRENEISLTLIRHYVYSKSDSIECLPSSSWFSDISGLAVRSLPSTRLLETVLNFPTNIQKAFVAEIFPAAPLSTIVLVQNHPFSIDGSDLSILSNIQHWETRLDTFWNTQFSSLLNDFVNEEYSNALVSPLWIQLLYMHFSDLDLAQQEACWSFIANEVDPLLGQWVFGKSTTGENGLLDALIIEQLDTLYAENVSTIQTMFEDLATLEPSHPLRDTLLEVGSNILRDEPLGLFGLAKLVSQISNEKSVTQTSFHSIEPNHLKFWLDHLGITVALENIQNNLDFCLLWLKTQPNHQTPSNSLLNDLHNLRSQNNPTWAEWSESLTSLEWYTLPRWRLLFIEHQTGQALLEVDEIELEYIANLHFTRKVELLYAGLKIHPDEFSTPNPIEQFQPLSQQHQQIILWYAIHFPVAKAFASSIVRGWILGMPKHEKDSLRKAVSGTGGFFSTIVQNVTDIFDKVPETLPESWNTREWVKEYLLSLDGTERTALLSD